VFAIGFIAIVAGVALVVDGGNAYANQRISQNASDAAAEAGAIVLAERLSGTTRLDDDVRDAVDNVLREMEMDVAASYAEYTDIDGDLLGVEVGSLGATAPPPAAYGVAVNGERDFGTFFARALGINAMTATTGATAVAGYGQHAGTNLLPVTPPVNIVTCAGNGEAELTDDPWLSYKLYVVPLCKDGPGNVGWIDWTPPAEGASELEQEILSSTGYVTVPSWRWVPQTGNTNKAGVEAALRTYDGDVVYIPLFDLTCGDEPTPGSTSVDACPEEEWGGGNGQNLWYHFPLIAAFQFCSDEESTDPAEAAFFEACEAGGFEHGAYINGGNGNSSDECATATGNGGTSCLVGRFVNFIGEGTVSGPLTSVPGPSKALSVQLIK
jgi:hypothetical protein